jgi:hypothetical protein
MKATLPDQAPTYRVACPYCGVEQALQLDPLSDDSIEIHCCKMEEGGCDSFFALWIKRTVTLETSRLDFAPTHTPTTTWNRP